jgi:hypothetical protein
MVLLTIYTANVSILAPTIHKEGQENKKGIKMIQVTVINFIIKEMCVAGRLKVACGTEGVTRSSV